MQTLTKQLTLAKRRSRKMISVAAVAALVLSGAAGAAVGYNLKGKDKTCSTCPKQGFVFTPAIGEKKHETCLLIIDPQNDFIEGGSLEVQGAKEDMRRLSGFIEKNKTSIDSICVTLDTHSLFHIGNAYAYTDKATKQTTTDYFGNYDSNKHISKQGIDEHIIKYANKLKNDGKSHTLWPLHCIMGTNGHSIDAGLNETITKWSDTTGIEARYILKGCNTSYENFSAFRSAGLDQNDYSNPNKEAHRFNIDLAEYLYQFKTLYIAGEAKTHCVADSTMDYVNWVKKQGNPKNQKVVVLWDCMSDVPYSKDKAEAFKNFVDKNISFVSRITAPV